MSGLDHVPDVRDGLTLVERAVVRAAPAAAGGDWAAGGGWAKCVATVGAAMRDAGITGIEGYDAVVRLAQPWRARYPLFEPQGNFGSVDDDPPASARYTEARRTLVAEAALGSDRWPGPSEPPFASPASPLAGSFPTLLANGSWEGIASIPPHHLGELVEAILLRLDDPSCSLGDILDVMPGPDYPTGGEIVDGSEVRDAYATGRGRIRLQGTFHVEIAEVDPGPDSDEWLKAHDPESGEADDDDWEFELMADACAQRVVITELPFGVTKGGDDGLIRAAVRAVHDRRLPEIKDIYDESDRTGMRLVVGIADDHDPAETADRMLAELDLEVAVPVLLVVLVDGEPQQCTLLELIDHFIARQRQLRAEEPDADDAIRSELLALAAAHSDARRTRIDG